MLDCWSDREKLGARQDVLSNSGIGQVPTLSSKDIAQSERSREVS